MSAPGGLWVLAAEGIPASSPLAQLATPLGILIFLGATLLLLRSNLGTKRGYLVLATSFFGFMFLLGLFWAYGAPGTPQAVGPTNLPGQQPNALQAKWIPFAGDATLADRGDLSVSKSYPEGFEVSAVTDGGFQLQGVDEELQSTIETGVDETRNFFSSEVTGEPIEATWVPEEVGYAETATGFPLIGITFRAVDDALQPDPDGETYTAFAYFDAGSPLLPAQLIAGLALLLFVLHAWLLDRDERLERRELETVDEQAEPEKVPANA
ncbi:MAG: hypothetical protein ACR2KP_09050 [Egibacteraceae bacterium]